MVTKTIARDLSVTLSGWRLDNPVIPASGTFGFGNEFRDFYDINILGTFSFKGTTRDARFGNPTPRIAECTAGMINAVEQDGQLSFEERMGCGFGACMGCSCKTKYGNKRICKEGPVLTKGEVIW